MVTSEEFHNRYRSPHPCEGGCKTLLGPGSALRFCAPCREKVPVPTAESIAAKKRKN